MRHWEPFAFLVMLAIFGVLVYELAMLIALR